MAPFAELPSRGKLPSNGAIHEAAIARGLHRCRRRAHGAAFARGLSRLGAPITILHRAGQSAGGAVHEDAIARLPPLCTSTDPTSRGAKPSLAPFTKMPSRGVDRCR